MISLASRRWKLCCWTTMKLKKFQKMHCKYSQIGLLHMFSCFMLVFSYDLSSLVDFFIDKNHLKGLPTYLLNHAPLFQRFKASNNSIEALDSDFFRTNQALKICSMDNNKLSSIRVDFRPYKNLKKLDFFNNTCINTSFNDWRKQNSIVGVQTEIEKSCR